MSRNINVDSDYIHLFIEILKKKQYFSGCSRWHASNGQFFIKRQLYLGTINKPENKIYSRYFGICEIETSEYFVICYLSLGVQTTIQKQIPIETLNGQNLDTITSCS